MFRTTTRTIAAVAAFTLLTSTGSLFARAKEEHTKGKKEPRVARIGPGGGIPHPGPGGIRADRLTDKTSHFQGMKEFAFAISANSPSDSAELPTVELASRSNTPGSIGAPGWLLIKETRNYAPGFDRLSGGVQRFVRTSAVTGDALLLSGASDIERPALHIPRLLDRASFSLICNGESGLQADGAVTFQF